MKPFQPTFNKSIVTITLAIVSTIGLTACQKSSKSVPINPPAPLVTINNPQAVLSNVFEQNFSKANSDKPSSKKGIFQSNAHFQVAEDSQGFVSASPDGTIIATDLQGKILWQIQFKQGLRSGVTLNKDGSMAIVSDSKANLIALDRSTGNKIWQKQLPSQVLSPTIIQENRIIALSNSGVVNGIALQSGDIIWQFATQNPNLTVRGTASPILLDNETALISTADGRIHAVNVQTGVPLWSRRISNAQGASEIDRLADIDATPVFDNQMLYLVSYSGQLLGIDMASRQVNFVKEIASLKSITVDDSQIYATSLSGKVFALDKFTGNENWQSETLAYRGLSNPAVSKNQLFVGDGLGYLHVFDKHTGNLLERKQTKADISLLNMNNQRLTVQHSNGNFSVWQIR